MPIWIIAFASVTAISATLFVAVAVLWLRRLRETVSSTLADATIQQVNTAHKLGEAIASIQKQHRVYEQQLHNLAQASLRLRQELTTVAHRLEHNEQTEVMRGDRTVH